MAQQGPAAAPHPHEPTEGPSKSATQTTAQQGESDTPALYIDVRSHGEFASGHLDGAHNLPLDQLTQGIARLAPDHQRALVLYCASGARSAHGCALLAQLGYTRASNGGGLGALALSSQRPVRRS